MDAYADGLRRHPEMESIARQFSQADRQAVSFHYAAMPFDPGVRGEPVSPPPALYTAGDPARGLQPCAACHGLAGEGGGPANPPLAGQPAAYLAEQLAKWRRSERRNDPGNVMLGISRRLSQQEVAALAAYAATLPGRPEYPAAFPAARRDDPRNDASTPRRHAAAR
ncbi:hypothetical protein D1610_15185 [Sphingomonas gilva]|uniref:Cytochrome c domain-containing protein n=1 Tax=Sphingomonas gilva TaxID=2305907 RepID=A0A396RK15_9SPHN|nr:hypothetical protein D1610_15185 [Sphingomonas gilva]